MAELTPPSPPPKKKATRAYFVLLALAVSLFQSRASLQLEILALRHYAEFRLMPSKTSRGT